MRAIGERGSMRAETQSSLGRWLREAAQLRAESIAVYLEELAALESPTDVPDSQGPIQARLAESLARLGFRIRRFSGRTTGGVLLALPGPDWGKGPPAQLLLGHSDTVWPLGTTSGAMPIRREGGRLWGPGVFDMKAGLALVVFALEILRESGLCPPLAPVVLVNSDEEVGSPESAPMIRRWARRVERAFVLEPALGPEGALKTARKGVARYRLQVRGRSAHAGVEPEKGANAILALAGLIQKVHALGEPTQGTTVNVGVVGGGSRANVVPDEAWALVDVRFATESAARALERRLKELQSPLVGTSVEVRRESFVPPLERTPRNRALWEAACLAARDVGLELGEAMVGGGSDGNLTSRYTATLDGLGGVGGGAHAPFEFVELASLPERTALLARLLLLPASRRETREAGHGGGIHSMVPCRPVQLSAGVAERNAGKAPARGGQR